MHELKRNRGPAESDPGNAKRKGWLGRFLDWLARGAEANAASGCAG